MFAVLAFLLLVGVLSVGCKMLDCFGNCLGCLGWMVTVVTLIILVGML